MGRFLDTGMVERSETTCWLKWLSLDRHGQMPQLSGVPQGSVLGSILFLIFINDIDCGIVNQLMKFADETKIFGTVNTMRDTERLQGDLDSLLLWSRDWQMEFNVGKCGVMHLGRGNGQYQYVLDGQEIQRVSEQKDLRMLIADNLKPSAHCVTVYKQASRVLAMMQRTIIYEQKEILLSLYKTLVRPLVEYCIAAWSPYYQKDKILLERIQHRYTRMFPELTFLPYEERLVKLGLWTFEERRNRADLIEAFKLVNRLVNNPFDIFLEKSTNSHLRGHFLSVRVVDRWNKLPQKAIDSTSVMSSRVVCKEYVMPR